MRITPARMNRALDRGWVKKMSKLPRESMSD
jgi:hypothetical protein